MVSKQCRVCEKFKDTSEFYKDYRYGNCVRNICKECFNTQAKQYQQFPSYKEYRQSEKHKQYQKEYLKKYYIIKKEELQIKRKKWREKNKEKLKIKQKEYQERKKEEIKIKSKLHRDKIKLEVLKYYSENEIPNCKMCGENHNEFLEIDHIKGGGREHKRNINRSTLHIWLKKNNYPIGYQILCSNCNIKKERLLSRELDKTRTKRQLNGIRNDAKLKFETMLKYSVNGEIKCSCPNCNVNDIDILCIDHIDNNGAEHRKKEELKGGKDMYRWLKRNNYPTGFRILCNNCNQALNNYGYCPHNKEILV